MEVDSMIQSIIGTIRDELIAHPKNTDSVNTYMLFFVLSSSRELKIDQPIHYNFQGT